MAATKRIERVGFSCFSFQHRVGNFSRVRTEDAIWNPAVRETCGLVPLTKDHWLQITVPVAIVEQCGASVHRKEFPANCRFRYVSFGSAHQAAVVEVEYPTEE